MGVTGRGQGEEREKDLVQSVWGTPSRQHGSEAHLSRSGQTGPGVARQNVDSIQANTLICALEDVVPSKKFYC